MITCAFVPEIPNADTPARLGRPWTDHARFSVSSSTEPDDQSTCEDGSDTCSVLGNISCRIAISILMTPATPAAACVCPRFDFTEPSHSGASFERPRP